MREDVTAGEPFSALEQAVVQTFAPEGPLANDNPYYRVREGQLRMARAVAYAIDTRRPLVVEAGTGVGKTFAYLVPALLSGQRTLVSTATKNLQDQLYARDLPYLTRLLGLPLRLALLKGRSSYVCLHRLELARHAVSRNDGSVLHAISRVERFVQATRSGDLSELEGLDERSPAIPLVTSTRDNCLGSQCPSFKTCYVNQARREALAADVVVVNHHLFFADMAVRESGMAELLPSVHTVVFDEAHQLNDIGTQFLGLQLGTSHVLELGRDVLATGLQLARGLADWQTVAAQLEQSARELRLVAGTRHQGNRLRWADGVPDGLNPDEWPVGLRRVAQALQDAVATLGMMSELAPDFERLLRRAQELLQRLEQLQQPCPADAVRWVEVAAALRLVQAPLDIADTVRGRMLRQTESDEAGQSEQAASQRAWIFTSATLGDAGSLRWFTEPCGLNEADTLQVDSPFDYAGHAGVYVPGDMPPPSDPAHPQALARLTAEAVRILGGRTLVLTTTLRNLQAIGTALKSSFEGDSDVEVLVQGEATKRRLIERFRAGDDDGSQPGCVLVASASFWEGVDVPGDSLQLVVIDKLPFPPPGDPLVEARSRRLETQGRHPFRDYFLPETAVTLKQGAGRLIRSEQDRGVLLIGDSRLIRMSYGRRLLRSLPPMRRLETADDFRAALQDLKSRSASAG